MRLWDFFGGEVFLWRGSWIFLWRGCKIFVVVESLCDFLCEKVGFIVCVERLHYFLFGEVA